MAKKRMFTLDIVDSDAFLDLPLSAQALYFHLCMRADDDGFLGNARRVSAYVGASPDDLKLLLAKRFLLAFKSGVIVIKHWRMHNTIKTDRREPTAYQEEFNSLSIKPNKSYTDRPLLEGECLQNDSTDGNNLEPKCLQNDSIDKDRLDKDRLGLDIDTDTRAREMNKDLLEAFKRYEAFRKGIKKPLTYESKILLINKLNTFPERDRLEIINTAIERGWMSFFPLDKKGEDEPMIGAEYEDRILNYLKEQEAKTNA